jgi:hypothetical protein
VEEKRGIRLYGQQTYLCRDKDMDRGRDPDRDGGRDNSRDEDREER